MLFQLVDCICADIDRINVADALEPIGSQLRQAAPETVDQFIQEARRQRRSDEAAVTALAALTLEHIKRVPKLARKMVQAVNDGRMPATRRCAVAGLLGYLVQPHDIIPDNAPGGYGFLDDCIFLRAGLVEYLDNFADISIDDDAKVVGYLINLTAPHLRPALQQGVSAMSLVVQFMAMLDGEIAESMLAQMIVNPLQLAPAALPRGYSPHGARNYAGGHWSGGAYFEGNSVVMSGGPSLIDGQLFIPS